MRLGRIRDQFESIRKGQARSRELQQQLEIAVDASELGTFHCDVPLDKIIWNARCKAHFWLPPETEVDFDLFYSILHPDDRERTREAIEACVYGARGTISNTGRCHRREKFGGSEPLGALTAKRENRFDLMARRKTARHYCQRHRHASDGLAHFGKPVEMTQLMAVLANLAGK